MSIYDSLILDYYHHPRNKRVIHAPDASCRVANQSCGDEVTVMLTLVDDVVSDCAYEGHMCAVSTASASLLSEKVVGMHVRDVCKLDVSVVTDLLDIELTPIRLKCALLPLEAIQTSLQTHLNPQDEA